jgi:NADPH2:quinone reductase
VKAAVVRELGAPPEVAELPAPEPSDGEVVLDVVAAALNPLDIAVGSGRFYGGHPPLPYVPGAEAVGRVGGGGDGLVWIFGGGLGIARNGTLAERATVPRDRLVSVPDGADPELAVALGVAGIAGWLPVSWRTPVRAGETVLVLGATGTVGFVAVQAAKLLGAGRVVAAGRDADALARALDAGADDTVQLGDGPNLIDALREACGEGGPTLIVDPLWGDVVVAALEVAPQRARVVHIGQSAGPEAPLPSRLVRAKEIEIYGFSNFTVPHDVLEREYARLLGHAASGEIRVDVEAVPLDDVAEAWRRQAAGANRKLVVSP